MPFFLRLSCSEDFGLHAGNLPGYRPRCGCIRLPWVAKQLFADVPIGTMVEIHGREARRENLGSKPPSRHGRRRAENSRCGRFGLPGFQVESHHAAAARRNGSSSRYKASAPPGRIAWLPHQARKLPKKGQRLSGRARRAYHTEWHPPWDRALPGERRPGAGKARPFVYPPGRYR